MTSLHRSSWRTSTLTASIRNLRAQEQVHVKSGSEPEVPGHPCRSFCATPSGVTINAWYELGGDTGEPEQKSWPRKTPETCRVCARSARAGTVHFRPSAAHG